MLQQQFTSLPGGLGIDNERSGGLPETWCGIQTATDDTVDDVYPDTDPAFKLVYAYASDQSDRFAALADKLQASVSLLTRYMAGQSDGEKTVRFDLGTNCGPQYVDIQTVALPQPKSYYVIAGVPQFNRLNDDVRAAVPLAPGSQRNLLVYADALRGTDGVAGTGMRFTTPGVADVPDATNPHNAGRCSPSPGPPPPHRSGTYAQPATLMHELSHNLGAVQAERPAHDGPQQRRALHRRAGPHVLRRRRAEQHADLHVRLPLVADDRRDVRLRPRRLLQPRAGPRLVPGHALEHLQLRAPRGLLGSGRRAVLRRRRHHPPGQHHAAPAEQLVHVALPS